MKRLIAAVVAALAIPVAFGQDTPVPKGPENLVAEPVASAYRTDGTDGERLKPIIDALNAEPSLKSSKITVAPDADVVYLTGVTISDAQRKKAMEIASQFAGEGKVANAITTEQVVITPAVS